MSPNKPPVIGGGVSRSRAWTCVAINLLVFPGVGTVMAGRKWGYAQVTLMVGGLLLLFWFVGLFFISLMDVMGGSLERNAIYECVQRNGWIGLGAVVLSLGAWCWALVSSIEMLQRAKKD